jgi:hypothetical protein
VPLFLPPRTQMGPGGASLSGHEEEVRKLKKIPGSSWT